MYYFKSAVLNMIPFLVVAAGILFWILRFLIKKKTLINCGFSNMVILTIVVVGHKYQPDVIDRNFTSFLCVNLYREDAEELYLEQDLDLKCWEGLHTTFTFGFALPLILLWFLVLPAILVAMLYKNRHRLQDS